MAFTGNENHDITLQEASLWTANYRNANPNELLGHLIGSNAIKAILAQAGCVGIRMYYAITDAGIKQLVLVGVGADGNDLYTGLLADRTFNCPPVCGATNPLNS